ncbi:MAG: lytic transglycosylase domain-containing protein [Proteocatella sp.]
MKKKNLFIFILVQTIFLSSTLAYADDININVNNTDSNISAEFIKTEIEEIAKTEDTLQEKVVAQTPVVKTETPVVKTEKSPAEQEKIKYKKAVVSFIKSRNGKLSNAAAEKVGDAAMFASKKHNIEINMILAIMLKESTFTANARNASCYGIMQVSKTTGAGFGYSVKDLLDPYRNADVATRLLKGQTKKFGSTLMGLTAYNAGGGNVSKGNYNTNYAKSVIAKSNTIKAYIKSYMSK